MKGLGRGVLVVLTLLVFFFFSAAATPTPTATAATPSPTATATVTGTMPKAVVVSDVRGLNDYEVGENCFTHGNTLKVYTELQGVNYDGFVVVDFFFIIEDPLGNVVGLDHEEVSRRNYDRNVFVVYTKTIPSWWKYGRYKLHIYAYDCLDKAKINDLEQSLLATVGVSKLFDDEDYFEDLEDLFGDVCGGDRDDLEDLDVIKKFSNSVEEITTLEFFVRSEEELKEASEEGEGEEGEEGAAALLRFPKIEGTNFVVSGVVLDKFKVQPDEPVSISVTVKNAGTKGTERVRLEINGKKEAEESVTLDYLESRTLVFQVKKSLPGTYKTTISGTEIVKMFFVEEPRESVSPQRESEEGKGLTSETEGEEGGEGGEVGEVREEGEEGEGGEGGAKKKKVSFKKYLLVGAFIAILAVVLLLLRSPSINRLRLVAILLIILPLIFILLKLE